MLRLRSGTLATGRARVMTSGSASTAGNAADRAPEPIAESEVGPETAQSQIVGSGGSAVARGSDFPSKTTTDQARPAAAPGTVRGPILEPSETEGNGVARGLGGTEAARSTGTSPESAAEAELAMTGSEKTAVGREPDVTDLALPGLDPREETGAGPGCERLAESAAGTEREKSLATSKRSDANAKVAHHLGRPPRAGGRCKLRMPRLGKRARSRSANRKLRPTWLLNGKPVKRVFPSQAVTIGAVLAIVLPR